VVRGLLVAHEGDTETFTFIVNFGHVVAARVAPYSVTRTSSF
jgi:hypothetical protein